MKKENQITVASMAKIIYNNREFEIGYTCSPPPGITN